MWRKRLSKVGTAFFVLSMAFFGVQLLLVAAGLNGPNSQSPWSVTDRGWSGLMAVVAIGGTIGLATSHARAAAILLALVAFARALVYVPDLTLAAQAENIWTNAFQLLAWCGTSLVLLGAFPLAPTVSTRWRTSWSIAARVGCFLYACSLPVFGIEHFVFARDIATMVPSWIPWHLFWTYFAGLAFLAAAVSIGTQMQLRVGATLLGIMFLLWVLVLWLPPITRDLSNADNWTNAVITLAMSGGAFMIAGLARVREPDTAEAHLDAVALDAPLSR